MTITEAARLAKVLLNDPSSATGAAARDLTCPVTVEARVLADLWDLVMAAAAGKKATPYARPWLPEKKPRPARTVKPSRRMSKDEFHARWAQLTNA